MRRDQNDPQLKIRWHYCSQHTIHPQVEQSRIFAVRFLSSSTSHYKVMACEARLYVVRKATSSPLKMTDLIRQQMCSTFCFKSVKTATETFEMLKKPRTVLLGGSLTLCPKRATGVHSSVKCLL